MTVEIFGEIKFEQLPDTFEQLLERLQKLFQIRGINEPQVIYFEYRYSTHRLVIHTGPLFPTNMFKSRFKRLYLYYSPTLKRFELPFGIRNRNLYKKRLELHYQLAKMAVEQWK